MHTCVSRQDIKWCRQFLQGSRNSFSVPENQAWMAPKAERGFCTSHRGTLDSLLPRGWKTTPMIMTGAIGIET